jgi:hypothetical protein
MFLVMKALALFESRVVTLAEAVPAIKEEISQGLAS